MRLPLLLLAGLIAINPIWSLTNSPLYDFSEEPVSGFAMTRLDHHKTREANGDGVNLPGIQIVDCGYRSAYRHRHNYWFCMLIARSCSTSTTGISMGSSAIIVGHQSCRSRRSL
jgi:hypothetical protein